MAYTKQNFENGQILTAEQLNHMEQGIAAPDWNDVINKPFYDIEPWIPPVTLPEPGAESMEILGHMISASATDKVCMIKENTKYVVNFNGTDYECESFTLSNFQGEVYLGNFHILVSGFEDNGLPFLLRSTIHANYEHIEVHLLDESVTSCAISIRLADEPTIKHLDPKYIKDMYYETEPVETVLVDNLASADAAERPLCNLVVGDAYRVIWNGVEYRCVCYDDDGWRILGGTDEYPFYIDDDGGDGLYIEARDGSDEWTVSVIHFMTELRYIAPKYIKDMYYETEMFELLVDNVTLVFGDESFVLSPVPFKLTEDEKYKVTWDGKSYDCVAYLDEWSSLCIGNGEPFAVVEDAGSTAIVTTEFPGEHTISIAEYRPEIHHVDNKYIKDMYGVEGEATFMGSLSFTATSANTMDFTLASVSEGADAELIGDLGKLIDKGKVVEVEINGAVGMMSVGQDRAYISFSGALSGSLHRSNGSVWSATVNIPGIALTTGTTYTVNFYNARKRKIKTIDPKYLPPVVLTSPNGKKFNLTVANDGTLSATPVS